MKFNVFSSKQVVINSMTRLGIPKIGWGMIRNYNGELGGMTSVLVCVFY